MFARLQSSRSFANFGRSKNNKIGYGELGFCAQSTEFYSRWINRSKTLIPCSCVIRNTQLTQGIPLISVVWLKIYNLILECCQESTNESIVKTRTFPACLKRKFLHLKPQELSYTTLQEPYLSWQDS